MRIAARVAAISSPVSGWLSDTSAMGSPAGQPRILEPVELAEHLQAPESAVVVLCEGGRQVAVWNAPHDAADPQWGMSYYAQDLPLDRPDATLIEADAWNAVLQACS